MIKEALDAFANSYSPPTQDRPRTVGASEIGQCERKIFWRKRGGTQDRGYRNAYGAHLRGTMIERYFWYPALKAKYGEDLLFAGEMQASFSSNFLSATPDGLVVNLPKSALAEYGVLTDENCAVVECKTIDPRTNLIAAKEEHTFQTQCQIGLIRETTPYKPNYAIISYTDASHWDEVAEYAVKFSEEVYGVAHARAKRILTATDPAQMRPEGYIAGGHECKWCPFTRACAQIEQPPVETRRAIDPQFVAEITDMCRKVVASQRVADGEAAHVKQLKQDVKERLRDKGLRVVPGVVRWSAVKARQSWDVRAMREAMAAAGIDPEQFSTVGEPTDQFVVDKRISDGEA